MKLSELKGILHSSTGNIIWAIVYDLKTHTDLANGCSVDYAVEHFADEEVKKISAYENKLVIEIWKA